MSFHVPGPLRVRTGPFASNASFGNNGAFFIPNRLGKDKLPFRVIASDGEGWEHVSVSLPERYPTWEEMCLIKGIFWDTEDCVVQFHPPESQYVNDHPNCLHLWRPIGHDIPTPPRGLVGIMR